MNGNVPESISSSRSHAPARFAALAREVGGLVRDSADAAVRGDVAAAARCASEGGRSDVLARRLRDAWSELLGQPPNDGVLTLAAGLLAALDTLHRLAGSLCVEASAVSPPVGATAPAISTLAERVLLQLDEAVRSLETPSAATTARLTWSGISADVSFAQSQTEIFFGLRTVDAWEAARRLRAISRALEQIGDAALDLATSADRAAHRH